MCEYAPSLLLVTFTYLLTYLPSALEGVSSRCKLVVT